MNQNARVSPALTPSADRPKLACDKAVKIMFPFYDGIVYQKLN